MPCLSRTEEADRILALYGDDLPAVMTMLERQFVVLHNRAQVLLTLCGIVISTTGFSGRIIAGTNALAQVLIVGGVALVLLSAAIVVWGVLHLRWLTMQVGADTRSWHLLPGRLVVARLRLPVGRRAVTIDVGGDAVSLGEVDVPAGGIALATGRVF